MFRQTMMLLGLVSLWPAYVAATTIVLYGQVTSWPSGDPIEDARVMVWDAAPSCDCECCEGAPVSEVNTDAQGRYLIILDGLPIGARYRLATENGTPCQSFRQRRREGAQRARIVLRTDLEMPEMCLPRFCC